MGAEEWVYLPKPCTAEVPQIRQQDSQIMLLFTASSLWCAGLLEVCSEGMKCPLGLGKMKVQLRLAWGHRAPVSNTRSESMELQSRAALHWTEAEVAAAEPQDTAASAASPSPRLLHPSAGGDCGPTAAGRRKSAAQLLLCLSVLTCTVRAVVEYCFFLC